ncbi:uncharacterized protein BDV14DRAFT_203827 [Aspergillus stella-maris]|uniref:uncharacterized protein n=1 Tax=Aspergillus stella-maris TaxID=1810926 RepID=UPI003CCD91F5
MAMSSNQKRASARQKCRTKLAAHLKTQLGLDVLPEKVRLRPRRDDLYQWKVAKPLHGLFTTKDLSNGTIGEFQKICTALDSGKVEGVLITEEALSCEDKYCPLIPLGNDNLEKLEHERESELREFEEYRERTRIEMHDAELRWGKERQDLQEQVLKYQAERDLYEAKLKNIGQMMSPILSCLTQHMSDEKS